MRESLVFVFQKIQVDVATSIRTYVKQGFDVATSREGC